VSTWKEKKFNNYVFDDVFDGLTTLRAPDDGSDIEYVFREWVHRLNLDHAFV